MNKLQKERQNVQEWKREQKQGRAVGSDFVMELQGEADLGRDLSTCSKLYSIFTIVEVIVLVLHRLIKFLMHLYQMCQHLN